MYTEPTKKQDIFTQDILRRVKRAYFYRTYLRPVAFEVSFLGALLGLSAFFVSLSHVFSNAYAERSIGEVFRFGLIAFEKTELSVKALSVAVVCVSLLAVRDISLGLRHVARGRRSAV